MWPFVGQYLEKLLVETIAPSIRASSTHLQTFGFTKVDMGDKVLLPISYVISHYRYRYHRYVLTGCVLPNQNVFCLLQAMKVVGIKAHTENDKGQVLLDLYIRWSFIYELLDVKTISVSLLLRRGYDCSFSVSSATSATWRSTLR